MEHIAISSETALDLPKSMIEEFDIHLVPFTIILGEKEEIDLDFPPRKIYDYVEMTGKLAKTAAVNEFAYREHFDRLLETYDHVIHLALGDRISSTYNNALKAASDPKYAGKVSLINTHTLSSAIGLQCVYAAKLAREGKGHEEIVAEIERRIDRVQVSFLIEKLDYLAKGGRCPKIVALGANLLRIHPQLIVKDGALAPGIKYRGPLSKVIKDYVDEVEKEGPEFDPELCLVAHTVMPPEMVEEVRLRCLARGFKRVEVVEAGGAVAVHCGPHAFGVIYYKKG